MALSVRPEWFSADRVPDLPRPAPLGRLCHLMYQRPESLRRPVHLSKRRGWQSGGFLGIGWCNRIIEIDGVERHTGYIRDCWRSRNRLFHLRRHGGSDGTRLSKRSLIRTIGLFRIGRLQFGEGQRRNIPAGVHHIPRYVGQNTVHRLGIIVLSCHTPLIP